MFPAFRKSLNASQWAIVAELLCQRTVRRTELSERLGLSPQTIMRALQPLKEIGLLAERSLRDGDRGQPAREINYRPGRVGILGIGLSEFAVSASLQDLDGTVLAERSLSGEVGDPERALPALRGFLEELREECPEGLEVLETGVAAQGFALEPGRRIAARGGLAGWARIDLAAWVEEATGRPARIANDATALAAWVASGSVAPNLFVLSLSSGVGGGLIADGRIVTGARGNAGEIGALVPDGPDRPTEPNMRRAFGLDDWSGLPQLDAARRAAGEAWLGRAAAALGPALSAAVALLDVEEVHVVSTAPEEVLEALIARLSLKLPAQEQIPLGVPAGMLVPPRLRCRRAIGLDAAACSLVRYRLFEGRVREGRLGRTAGVT